MKPSTRSRLATAGLLAALALFPAGARAEEDARRGLGVLQVSLGGGDAGASNLLLGVGVGLLDTGRWRLDLLGSLGGGRQRDARMTLGTGDVVDGRVGPQWTLVELTVARRLGGLELWGGGGWARGRATFDYEVSCNEALDVWDVCNDGRKRQSADGSTVSGPEAVAGARWGFGSRLLVELAGRWQPTGSSRIASDLTTSVGGLSVVAGIVWRIGRPYGGPASPAPAAAEPR